MIFPLILAVPLIVMSCRVEDPLTVKLLSICTLLSGIKTLPVPLVLNSKSALEFVTCILFVLIKKSSTFISLTFNCFHFLSLVPKKYVLSSLGIISEEIFAGIVILIADGFVMVTPLDKVTLPVTVKFWLMFVS